MFVGVTVVVVDVVLPPDAGQGTAIKITGHAFSAQAYVSGFVGWGCCGGREVSA